MLISEEEINLLNLNGAVVLRNKFDKKWISKLRQGIKKAKSLPSPRLTSHTIEKNQPAYYEDYWSWNLFDEFKEFVFKSPTAEIAAELLGQKKLIL